MAEPEDLEPYLALAREIRRDVERIAADDAAGAESLVDAIDRFPRAERDRVAHTVFERLSPDAQWAVLEKAFGDEEIRDHLRAERQAGLDQVKRDDERLALVRRFRAARQIETSLVPQGIPLTLGMFREREVAAAVQRGARSTNAARRLVLRAGAGHEFRVVEDVFNPQRGFFVSGDYDERVWRGERLESHQEVRVGSINALGDDVALEPVLVAGARVDVSTDEGQTRGRLHLGFAMLADDDIFAG